MRFMVMIKANADSEAGIMPGPEIFEAMNAYNEQLVAAGVMLGGEGLHPSSAGARVSWNGDNAVVTDGPFAETKELVAGYWIWRLDSLDDAVEWVKRGPFGDGVEIEIRRVFDTEDFGDALPESVRAAEARMREQLGTPE
ncbi:MAG TPA: YciI family protein [Thermomicrobiales bacterium]|nr:YciI family protein [Thermomicrobiales bacterium]